MMVLGWIIFSFVVGMIAKSRELSFWAYFLASLALTPILGLLIVLVDMALGKERAHKRRAARDLKNGILKTCPHCAEVIKSEAAVCHFCGRDLFARPAGKIT